MRLYDLNRLISNPRLVDERIRKYIQKKIIELRPENSSEIQGHLEKAQHNLNFITDNIKLKYYDWCISGCYYAVYHSAIALILVKGYYSKKHDATLCILIKEYYKNGLDDNEIKAINQFFFDYHDILFYVQSKNRREEATHSSKRFFDESLVKELQLKAVLFINKTNNILKAKNIIQK